MKFTGEDFLVALSRSLSEERDDVEEVEEVNISLKRSLTGQFCIQATVPVSNEVLDTLIYGDDPTRLAILKEKKENEEMYARCLSRVQSLIEEALKSSALPRVKTPLETAVSLCEQAKYSLKWGDCV